MDHNEQAGKNFAWLSVAQVGTRVLGAAFFIFLSYKLREIGLGEYSFVASFVPMWFLIVDFGGGGFLFREWTHGIKSQEEIRQDFYHLFTLRLIIVSAVALPFVAVNYFINRQVLGSLVLFYISMFLAMFVNLMDLYYQSQNLYRFLATRQIIEKSVAVLGGFGFLLVRPSVGLVFLAILISQLASIAYYYLFTPAFVVKLAFSRVYAKKLFFKGLPFLFIGIFASLYGKIDVTMLRYMTNFQSVGYYSAAYKFIDFSYIFVSLFVASVYPLLSPLWHKDSNGSEFKDFFLKCFRILFSVGLVGSLSLIILAPWLVKLFFPATFGPAVLAMRILSIGLVLSFVSALFNTMLIIQNREKIGLAIVAFGAVFNIALNFLLIPRFGFYGSAWATVIAEAGNLYLLQRYTRWHKPTGLIVKLGILVVCNAAIFSLLKFFGQTNSLYAGAAVLLTNTAILFTVKLLEKQDIALFINPFIAKFKSLTA